MIWDLYRAGVDALIIQDMGITRMNLPPIPLHSSTQCDTLEPEDVQHLEALGFEQVVLARELNVEQIRRIRAVTTVPLEVFIHGALCVSYSGRCYLSHALTGRSANRGECSQQCRLPYDLIDDEGRKIRTEEHLLSPRDLNRTEVLEQILEAGASSLKIEGRLKGESYVKNITAHYRRELDRIIALHPEKYRRASFGEELQPWLYSLSLPPSYPRAPQCLGHQSPHSEEPRSVSRPCTQGTRRDHDRYPRASKQWRWATLRHPRGTSRWSPYQSSHS